MLFLCCLSKGMETNIVSNWLSFIMVWVWFGVVHTYSGDRYMQIYILCMQKIPFPWYVKQGSVYQGPVFHTILFLFKLYGDVVS